MNRDDYFRCKICGQLFTHEECTLDTIRGYLCPRGCQVPFKQEDYESPFQDE